MRLDIQDLATLLATADRWKNNAITAGHNLVLTAQKKGRQVRDARQEWQQAGKRLLTTSRQLNTSVSHLAEALNTTEKTLVSLDQRLNHWQRANEVPLAKIKKILKKHQP